MMKRALTASSILVILLLAACDTDSTIQDLATENQRLRSEVQQIVEVNQELQTQTREISRIIDELQLSLDNLDIATGGSETGGSSE